MARGGDFYYAVARGRRVGIYRTWSETEEQVKGFSGAIIKKCTTESEAQAFLHDNGSTAAAVASLPAQAASEHADNDDDIMKELEDKAASLTLSPSHREVSSRQDPGFVVFCSGSALDNGSDDGHAAFACVFLEREDWDIVELLDGASKSNRAVYCAALRAIQRVNELDPEQVCALTICSNSQLLINTMTKWISTYRTNGWRTSKGKAVKNQDILKGIQRERGRRSIQWDYAKAHTVPQTYAMGIDDAARKARALATAARSAPARVDDKP